MVSERDKRIGVEKWCNNTAWRQESIRIKPYLSATVSKKIPILSDLGLIPGLHGLFLVFMLIRRADSLLETSFYIDCSVLFYHFY